MGIPAFRLNFTEEGYEETREMLELFALAYGFTKPQRKRKSGETA